METQDENTLPSATIISEKFLLGDLIKMVVGEIKLMPFAWGMLPQADQQRIIDRITEKTKEAVRQTVKIIASDARPHIYADVESVTFKGGIKAVMNLAKSSAERHELADAIGSSVLIVLPNVDHHLGGDPPVADPDQMALKV